MTCEEKQRLLGDYEQRTNRVAASITDLNQRMGTSPQAEYDRHRRIVDEERGKSEQARLALEQHIAGHGC
jgi:hypothetical protein